MTWRRARWVLFLAMMALPLRANAAEDDTHALVRRALAALPRVPFVAKLKLSVDRGEPRLLEVRNKPVGNARASYLEVSAPIEYAGMRFLFLEHADKVAEQYLKIPQSPKIIQVGEELRKYSFLGSAFYVADLIEPELDAFTYQTVGEDQILKRRCKLIEAVPKNPERALYARMVVAVDPKDLLILKRLFLDENRNLQKVWTVEKVEKVSGYWTMLDQRMRDLHDKTESRLEITEVSYGVDLPDSTFTPQHLAR